MDNITDLGYTSEGITYKGLPKQQQTFEQRVIEAVNGYAVAIQIISQCPCCSESYKRSLKARAKKYDNHGLSSNQIAMKEEITDLC